MENEKLLNEKYKKYCNETFIKNDPICIPHRFSDKQDIEIAGFFAAIFAWGNRKTIIKKCDDLLNRMNNKPFEFITLADHLQIKKLKGFKHRTFNDDDLIFTVKFLKNHYLKHNSLEDAFLLESNTNTEKKLINFKNYFSVNAPTDFRTLKHISTPLKNSACKRLNMFLRWMVRSNKEGVDFGLWTKIKPSELIIPCDVHVVNSARKLGFTTRRSPDWKMASEITNHLIKIDQNDPIKYDFALFGMGIENYFSE